MADIQRLLFLIKYYNIRLFMLIIKILVAIKEGEKQKRFLTI